MPALVAAPVVFSLGNSYRIACLYVVMRFVRPFTLCDVSDGESERVTTTVLHAIRGKRYLSTGIRYP